MKKIPSVFVRDRSSPAVPSFVRDEVTPGCEWVLAGEGRPTKKYDGAAVLVKGGVLYARYDAKDGKAPPPGAIPCQEAPDPVTGHWPHWVLADRPQDLWLRAAFHFFTSPHRRQIRAGRDEDGSYEACGPNINSNREGWQFHDLVPHGEHSVGRFEIDPLVLTFAGIRDYLLARNRCFYLEGIVWHHPDGRMAKIKTRDFAPVEKETAP